MHSLEAAESLSPQSEVYSETAAHLGAVALEDVDFGLTQRFDRYKKTVKSAAALGLALTALSSPASAAEKVAVFDPIGQKIPHFLLEHTIKKHEHKKHGHKHRGHHGHHHKHRHKRCNPHRQIKLRLKQLPGETPAGRERFKIVAKSCKHTTPKHLKKSKAHGNWRTRPEKNLEDQKISGTPQTDP